jgi:putative ABC transport system permease protein
MLFFITMAWRETRAAWRHFLYFFFCIALGVATLVGVGLFATNVERTVAREARGLMGGDLEIRLSRPISANGQAILQSLESREIRVLHISELVAMASRPERETFPSHPSSAVSTQLIELKAVEPAYPFYGMLTIQPDRPVSDLVAIQPAACLSNARTENLACYGTVVQDALLIKMGLQVGDELKIGHALFKIMGVLKHEPDRVVSAVSLGPRVMISQDALSAAQLVKPGSRVRERYLLRVPSEIPHHSLLVQLREQLANDSAHVSTFREAQPQLRRFLDQLTRYLGLVGLTALFVGGLGVASSIHAFVKDKLKTIAILKTLGADSGTVIRTYLFQALGLGLMGSLAGVAGGVSLQFAMPVTLGRLLPSDLLDLSLSQGLSPEPMLKGLALGVTTTLLFTLWPLLRIREIRPALMFRNEMVDLEKEDMSSKGRFISLRYLRDPMRWVTVVLVSSGLSGLAMWQADSVSIGMMFIGALVAAVLLLTIAARIVIRWLRITASPSSLAVRYAVGNLSRPGSQASSIMVAIGIGVMIIVTISLLERSLVRQIGESRPLNAPTFFFIDVQPDQKEAFEGLIRQRFSHLTPELTPLVRSRLHAVNGQPVPLHEEDDRERRNRRDGEQGKSWYFTREYVLTFLDRIPDDNTIIKGTWWDPTVSRQEALVSVEEDAARHLGVDIGSTLEFDIQGTVLPATVSSIRKVEWNNFSTNFYMILSPHSLEGAPVTFVATVRVSPADGTRLQQAVVEAFPNITAINIGEVMDTFARVLEHLSMAIRAIAVFCMVAGGLVMAAALATTRYRRLYESVVLKTLGATRLLIAGSFATEYAFMGAVAGLIGTILASVLSWGVLYFIFELPWTLQPMRLMGGIFLTVMLTLGVGFLSTFRILGQRPLTILRHE